MKTCFIALELLLTSYLLVLCSLYSDLNGNVIMYTLLLRFLNSISERHLSLWVCFQCHTLCAQVHDISAFRWYTVDFAWQRPFESQGTDGISQQWRKMKDSKLLFTDKFTSISKYKLFSFTWEILDVIFNSGSCLFFPSPSPSPSPPPLLHGVVKCTSEGAGAVTKADPNACSKCLGIVWISIQLGKQVRHECRHE